MKKLTIGRNNACDIIVPDTSDLVSRKQAVLTVSFWGKMVLYDTSNNGTYVNGQRLENGKGIKVTRRDNINFARVADLDWEDVKDPYRKSKIISIICGVSIFIVVALIALWVFLPSETKIQQPVPVEEKGETVTTVKPEMQEEEEQPDPVKKPKKKSSKKTQQKDKQKKEKSVTPNKNEVNEQAPILY